MSETRSLDERYLEFRDRTAAVFAEFPQLEPLRIYVFKELLVRRRKLSARGMVKHWLRPLVRRGHTTRALQAADVLVWIENQRDVVTGTLTPIYQELIRRGVTVQQLSPARSGQAGPTIQPFRYTPRIVAPDWAKQAWATLVGMLPLDDPMSQISFLYACANLQGMLDEVNRVLNIVQPKIVLDASTGLPGSAALQVMARSQGIISLLLQHGITQVFYTPMLADYMLTWGPSSNDTLASLGVERSRLVASGSPRHDAMRPAQNSESREALAQALGLADKPTLVFFANGNDLVRNGHAPIECARWLEAVAAEYSDDINVVVRLHPNEDGSLYAGCPHLHITKNQPDLVTTLQGCTWIGSLCSTVLYEGLLFNKPVWQFYADGWPELADNWRQGLATRVSSCDDLAALIKVGLETGGYPADGGVVERVFANHGRATQAVADFVCQHLAGVR